MSNSSTYKQGFTLIELLIVLVIIGVGAATIRLAVLPQDPMAQLEKRANEVRHWIIKNMDQSLLMNEEFGLYFSLSAIGMMTWREGDPENSEPDIVWEFNEQLPLEFDNDIRVELILDIESLQWVTLDTSLPEEAQADSPIPHVIFFPSEEYEPSFKMIFRHTSNTDEQISLTADGFNTPEVRREPQ